ncbi:MAG: HAMP domain-containing histidine kinase [Deltaproteobacteria bacterium]|nr:HAMP domain-containing histidine kinase [Deltaproteobacteria bacterium]
MKKGKALETEVAEHKQEEIAFFGKITAAATHEMKNVLAIIKETAGLMEDLVILSPEMPASLREKCQSTLSVIQNQIKRGVDISDHLNWFAHCTDVPTASMDLSTTAAQMIHLAQRFARLKGVVLEVEPSEASITVQVRPVFLLMTLFTCIRCCLNALSPGSRIVLAPEEFDTGSAFSFLLKEKDARPDALFSALSADAAWSDLQQMVAALEGAVQWVPDGPCIRLQLPEPLA